MPYAICRIKNLHRSDLKSTQIHNAREHEEYGYELPDHINPEGRGLYGTNTYWCRNEDGLEAALDELIKETGAKERSNSTVAIEYMLTVGKDGGRTWEAYCASGFFRQCKDFVEQRHGKGSILSYAEHFDENNPHVHIVVSPIENKEVKWKNSRGKGINTEARFCAKKHTGGKELLRKLQDDYQAFCWPVFARYGVNVMRGLKVEEKQKEYANETLADLGLIRDESAEIKKSINQTLIEAKEGKISLEKAQETLDRDNERLKELAKLERQLTESALDEVNNLQKFKEKEKEKAKEVEKVVPKKPEIKKNKDFGLGF